MRGFHLGKARGDMVRKWNGLARRHVDMQRHVLRRGREPALLGMVQLLEIMQPLGIEIEELKGDADEVAGIELAQIAHMDFGGEAGVLALLQISEPAAEE